MGELLTLSFVFLLSGTIFSLFVFLVNLTREGPWTEIDTESVTTPFLISLIMAVCICTLGVPVLLAVGYKILQKIRHPDSKIL